MSISRCWCSTSGMGKGSKKEKESARSEIHQHELKICIIERHNCAVQLGLDGSESNGIVEASGCCEVLTRTLLSRPMP